MKTRIGSKLFLVCTIAVFSFLIAIATAEIKKETKLTPGKKKQETQFKEGAKKLESKALKGAVPIKLDKIQLEKIMKDYGTGLYDVGVIPNGEKCPSGSERIMIYMDDEDDNNNNSASGWIGSIQQGRNTRFYFCKVRGDIFKPFVHPDCDDASKHYAVLKLGASCPPGSIQFTRFFDNEDHDNANSSSGNIYPNISDNNTLLYFCLFTTGLDVMNGFPDIGIQYGVFGNNSHGIDHGYVRTDDEDDYNTDYIYSDGSYIDDIKAIIDGWENTRINLSRVK